MTRINNDAAVAEITQLYARYEAALCHSDVATLKTFFWDSPEVVRFGLMENLYGKEAISAYRDANAGVKLSREISNFKVTTFDLETAVVTLEFYGGTVGQPPRSGRLTQVWRHFPEGWRIVSAHVSWLPPI